MYIFIEKIRIPKWGNNRKGITYLNELYGTNGINIDYHYGIKLIIPQHRLTQYKAVIQKE